MFDIHIAQLVLNKHKIAYLIADQTLTVIDCGGNLQLFQKTQLFQETRLFAGIQERAHREIEASATTADPNGLLGTTIVDLTPELSGQEGELHALLAGDLSTFCLEFINRENIKGDVVYLTLTLYPHQNEQGQIQGLLYLLEDVTATGRVTQQLTQQHNELYLVHNQLNEANLRFAAANAELRVLDELKSRFVSIAAHELRTPIATMLGYVDFMREDDQDLLSQSQQKSITVIRRSIKRLLTITTDLLDVTRLEAGRMELILESIDLQRLLNAVLTEFQPEITKKQLAVTLSPSQDLPPTLCDEKRTIQIFTNLLSNAIKYTPEQGEITIALHSSQAPHPTPAMATSPSEELASPGAESTSTVLVEISDTGIGIPAVDLANIGKAFFRASNAHKARVNGTGLGLHITRSLCELQGGKLWFESQEGQGTTVFVTVPIDDGIFAFTQFP